jgi:hypothetical protein
MRSATVDRGCHDKAGARFAINSKPIASFCSSFMQLSAESQPDSGFFRRVVEVANGSRECAPDDKLGVCTAKQEAEHP